MTTNVDAAGKFYADLFGWRLEQSELPGMEYTLLYNGDDQIAGLFAQPKEMAGAPSVWCVYFQVESFDDTAGKVAGLGGKMASPPMEVPSVGKFAAIADPQGAVFSILEPSPE